MTKKVYVEPERLRKFAGGLKNFRSQIHELTDRLNGNLNHLSESWQDQEFDKFKLAIDTARQRLRKFSEEVERIAPQIERDARAAEEIHNQKLPNV